MEKRREKGESHSAQAVICNETEAIQLQLREEEWARDDDDEQGGSLFHRRLFVFLLFVLLLSLFSAAVGHSLCRRPWLRGAEGRTQAEGHNSFTNTH